MGLAGGTDADQSRTKNEARDVGVRALCIRAAELCVGDCQASRGRLAGRTRRLARWRRRRGLVRRLGGYGGGRRRRVGPGSRGPGRLCGQGDRRRLRRAALDRRRPAQESAHRSRHASHICPERRHQRHLRALWNTRLSASAPFRGGER